MDFFQSVAAARIIFFLGILNFVLILLIFFSCRCISGSRIGSRLMTQRFYKRFFAKHCYLWYVFWLSVTIHAFLAITLPLLLKSWLDKLQLKEEGQCPQ